MALLAATDAHADVDPASPTRDAFDHYVAGTATTHEIDVVKGTTNGLSRAYNGPTNVFSSASTTAETYAQGISGYTSTGTTVTAPRSFGALTGGSTTGVPALQMEAAGVASKVGIIPRITSFMGGATAVVGTAILGYQIGTGLRKLFLGLTAPPLPPKGASISSNVWVVWAPPNCSTACSIKIEGGTPVNRNLAANWPGYHSPADGEWVTMWLSSGGAYRVDLDAYSKPSNWCGGSLNNQVDATAMIGASSAKIHPLRYTRFIPGGTGVCAATCPSGADCGSAYDRFTIGSSKDNPFVIQGAPHDYVAGVDPVPTVVQPAVTLLDPDETVHRIQAALHEPEYEALPHHIDHITGDDTAPESDPVDETYGDPAPEPEPTTEHVIVDNLPNETVEPSASPTVPAVDFSPLADLPIGEKFPFAVPAWVAGALGGLGGETGCPGTGHTPSAGNIGGASIPLPWCELQPMIDVVRPVFLYASLLGLAWLFAGAAMGFGGSGATEEE